MSKVDLFALGVFALAFHLWDLANVTAVRTLLSALEAKDPIVAGVIGNGVWSANSVLVMHLSWYAFVLITLFFFFRVCRLRKKLGGMN